MAARRWGQAGIQEELPTVAEVLEALAELGRVFNKTGQYSAAVRKREGREHGILESRQDQRRWTTATIRSRDRRCPSDATCRACSRAMRTAPSATYLLDNSGSLGRRRLEPGLDHQRTTGGSGAGASDGGSEAASGDQHGATTPAAASPPAPAPTPRAAPSSPAASPPVARPAVTAPPPERSYPRSPSRGFPLSSGPLALGWSRMPALAAAIYYCLSRLQRAPLLQRQRSRRRWQRLRRRLSRPLQSLRPNPSPERVPARLRPLRLVWSAKRSLARAKPAPAPLPTGEFDVAFRAMGAEAEFVCGDGQSGRFIGMTRRKFSDVTTCRVTIDGKVGAVQVKRESTVSCSVSGAAVVCTGT